MTIPIPMTLDNRPSGKYVPGKLMWWHDAIIDLMLGNPSWTKKRIAQELNATPGFIYMITTSDMFAVRFAKRREEYERNLGIGITAKVTQVADKTLDRILSELSDPAKPIPIHHLESLADKTLSRLGYGPKLQPPSASVNIQALDRAQVVVIPAARADLDAARALIRDKEDQLAAGTPTELITVEPSQSDSAASTLDISDLKDVNDQPFFPSTEDL